MFFYRWTFLVPIQRKICHVLMINLLMIVEQAVFTLCSITLLDKKIRFNSYKFLCVRCLINILFIFAVHLNWIERYSTIKSDVFFSKYANGSNGVILKCCTSANVECFNHNKQ